MSAAAASMREHVDALAVRVPREIHPSARVIIGEWLGDMRMAADAGDMREVARLVRMVRAKIVDELRWEAVKYETARDGREAYRLRRRADRFEAAHG